MSVHFTSNSYLSIHLSVYLLIRLSLFTSITNNAVYSLLLSILPHSFHLLFPFSFFLLLLIVTPPSSSPPSSYPTTHFPFLLLLFLTGEKVSQGKIRNRGSEYTKSEFPLLDYMTSCELVAENVPWRYEKQN